VIGSIRVEGLVLGLCLVGLGVVWTLANLGHLDLLETLRRWWPASLVLWGALELIAAWSRRERAGRSR
jgi:cell wall-active antibiotic response 4TMS protein YvqF